MHQRQAEQAEASAQLARLEEQQRHRRDTASRLQRDLDGVRQSWPGSASKSASSATKSNTGKTNSKKPGWPPKKPPWPTMAKTTACKPPGAVPPGGRSAEHPDPPPGRALTRQRDLARQQAQHAETALRRQNERRERLHDERAA